MSVPRVSRYQLSQHGEVLTTRAFGAEVAADVCARAAEGDVLLLSFSGVEVSSLPFVDELVKGLQREFAARPERMLVAYGMNSGMREHVLSALEGNRTVLAVLTARGIGLLGDDGELRDAMRAAQKLEQEFTAAELAGRLVRRPRRLEASLRTLVAAGALGGRGGGEIFRRPPRERLARLAH